MDIKREGNNANHQAAIESLKNCERLYDVIAVTSFVLVERLCVIARPPLLCLRIAPRLDVERLEGV
jgi:hypothetical protein